jgi:hypothetical protein
MHDDYIGRHIRRATRAVFLLSALPVVAALLLGIQYHRFLGNLLQSPVAMTASELQDVSNPELLRRYRVALIGDQLFPTNFQKVRETRTEDTNQVSKVEVEQRFSILNLGNHNILVSSTDPVTDVQIRGALVPIPQDVREYVLSKIEHKRPEMAGTFLPMMLDTQEFASEAWILPICGLLPALLGVWGVIKSAQWSSNPADHPIGRYLQKRGNFDIMTGRIDAEVRSEGGSDSGTLVTASWLLHPWPFGLKVRALSELAWAHKVIVRHRVNFIPAGKTYHAKIFDRQGKLLQVQGKEANLDALLGKLSQRAPWIVVGFSPAIEALFKKRRPEFLAEVDKRKAALNAGSASAAKPQPQAKKPVPVGVA